MSETSHREILRSTGLIGGSQALTIIFAAIRTKILALILGPGGFGIAGMFMSITGLVGTATGLGIRESGVREIAEAAGTGDAAQIRRTAAILRRVSLATGFLGAMVLALLAFPISIVSFGDTSYGWDLVLLSVTLLFGAVAAGQWALIQGLRRVGDLARLSTLGGLAGAVLSIPLVYAWGTAGIAPSLVVVSVATLVISSWYVRRTGVQPLSLSWKAVLAGARPLVRIGVVFMTTALLAAASAYLARVLVSRRLGPDALGYYQAAYTLAGLYGGAILNAMGADFYPRLTAAAQDHPALRRLVNEQVEVALLVGAPGVVATMLFSPLVIRLFYSAAFTNAVPVLRWQVLGVLLQLVAVPLGLILVAKGDARTFLWTETAGSLVNMALIWLGIVTLGLVGAGVAFFALYAFYAVGMYAVVRRRHGFSWTRKTLQVAAVVFPTVGLAFFALQVLPEPWASALGAAATVAVSTYSVRQLDRALGTSVLALVWHKLLSKVGFGSSPEP